MIINNPISIQGQVTRAVDFSPIKHNEDNRGFVDQLNIQKIKDDHEEAKAKQVGKKDETENQGERHDAKEKGKNEYYGNGGRGRGKNSDGVIIKKSTANKEIRSIDFKI
ncbi:MAG: hypothetical protein FWC09_09990 [Lachnospiraceae bacterium]|nr:hypothetical protein [Lachnospiraceae bacterium]